jgi:hypothetical protein
VFIEIVTRLRTNAPGERNKFLVTNAVKSTNSEGDVRSQVGSHGSHDRQYGTQVKSAPGKKSDSDSDGIVSDSERYESLMPISQDDFGTIIKKTLKSK